MFTTLMVSAKMASVGRFKIKVFWNKGYDDILFVHDITKKTLSRDSNYNLDVLMSPLVTPAFLWE